MYLYFSQIFQYVCEIHNIMNMVELNSFGNEKESLKNDFFNFGFHLTLLQTWYLPFFHLNSYSVQLCKRTPFVISNQPQGPSNSVCLLLVMINVRCTRESLGQSWINCPLISLNRDWLKSWGLRSVSKFCHHFEVPLQFRKFIVSSE